MDVEQQPVNLKGSNLQKKSKQQIQLEEQIDDYGGNINRSFENIMMEHQELNDFHKQNLEVEKSIVEYLSSLKLRMKTDPKTKQDRYYRRQKKNFTSLEMVSDSPEISPLTKYSDLTTKVNSILERRKTLLSNASTNQSISSTPMIQFFKQQEQQLEKEPAEDQKFASENQIF